MPKMEQEDNDDRKNLYQTVSKAWPTHPPYAFVCISQTPPTPLHAYLEKQQ